MSNSIFGKTVENVRKPESQVLVPQLMAWFWRLGNQPDMKFRLEFIFTFPSSYELNMM